MRGLDGRLIADLNDNLPANATGSILPPGTSSLDENLTEYVLLPVAINDPPYISQSIYESSTPVIKPIQFIEPGYNNLFVDSQGVVKVLVGTSFKLKMKALQPPIYNVENGRPTLIVDTLPLPPPPTPATPVTLGTLESQIQYTWFKDDLEILNESDLQRSGSFITVNGLQNDELVFNNVSPNFAGVYTCQALNDIGFVESEQITIEVYNPDIEDSFFNNLIDNPYGKNDTDQWLSPNTEFKTSRLTNTPFKDLSQPWNRDVFAYTVDMLYPRPYHINTYHIKNSNFTEDLLTEGYYFTRDTFKYKAKDGQVVINAEYDVDLSEIVDYTQGAVYGISGVRAVFGAYLGNAISKYRSTITTALAGFRSFKNTVDTTKPRISKENCLLAGVPVLDEKVTVTVTELDGETTLMSRIYDINTGNVTIEPGIELIDPWTKRVESTPFVQLYTAGNYISTGGPEERLIYIGESLLPYPSQNYIATYAQFAEWNKVVIDKLNFRTNKIRISLNFTSTAGVLEDTSQVLLDESDDCFEFEPWETIALTGRFPQRYPNDFYLDPNGLPMSLYDINRLAYSNTTSLKQYFSLLGAPRALATGLNLVLLPIETADKPKLDYYTKTILEGSINTSSFSAVNTSVSPVTPLAQYLASLDYKSEYIGVHLTNIWRIPHRIQDVDNAGNLYYSDNLWHATTVEGADIASLTAVSTFKYISIPPVAGDPTSEIYNLTDDAKGNWVFASLKDLDADLTGSVEIIYFTGAMQYIAQGSLPDIRGTVQSGILNFVSDGLTSTVPIGYVTASIVDTEAYKRNLGFYFDFEIHKHGRGDLQISNADTASIFRAWKEPDPTWTVPRFRHKHNLLQDVALDYANIASLPPPPPSPPLPPSGSSTGSNPPPTNTDTYYTLAWDPVAVQEAMNQNNASVNPSNNLVTGGQAGQLLNNTDGGYKIVFLSDALDAITNNITSSFVRGKCLDFPRQAINYNTALNDVWRLGAKSILLGLEGYSPTGTSFDGPVEYYYWVISRNGLNGYFNQNFYIPGAPFTDPDNGPPEATVLYPGSTVAAQAGANALVQAILGGVDTTALEIWDVYVGNGPSDYFNTDYTMTGYIDPTTGDIKAWPYTLNDLFEITVTATTVNFILSGAIVHTIPRAVPGSYLRFSAKHCATNNNKLNFTPGPAQPISGLTNIQYGPYDENIALAQQKGLPAVFQTTDTGWISVYDEYEVNNYVI